MITLDLASSRGCRLPARPRVRILVAGRPVHLRQVPFPLGAENVPRRTIGPNGAATAILRWQNWCGPRGRVAVRLTLGGVSVVEQLGSTAAQGPTCVDRARPSTLGVSLFVRR